MKLPIGFATVVLASVFTVGCSAKPPSPPPLRISDAYAKAALKALDTIYLIRRGAPEALINADAEAVGSDETALTKKLYSIYEQEQFNESARRYLAASSNAKNARRINAAVRGAMDSCEDKFIQERDLILAEGIKHGKDIALPNEEARVRKEKCQARVKPPGEEHDDVPTIQEIDRREAACYKLFADALRNRSVTAPKQCDSLSVDPRAAE